MRINNSFFGFCCLAFEDGSYPGTNFKSTTLTWCQKNPAKNVEEKLKNIYRNNLLEYCKVLAYCVKKQIKVYRVSSSMFPLADHQSFSHIFDAFSFDTSWNSAISSTLNFFDFGGKLSTHPGQFVSITSREDKVVENSISNLNFHAEFMDKLGLHQDYRSHINIHLSNGSKCPKMSAEIAKDALKSVSPGVLKRLTFENEDKGCWKVSEIRQHFPKVPIVFDSLHYKCNPDSLFLFDEAFFAARESWFLNAAFTSQTVHHSEGRSGPKCKKHSDYVENIPEAFKNNQVFCEIEAKKKNLAVVNYKLI